MKVATTSLNRITLSSTSGHAVSVLASGRLRYVGYASFDVAHALNHSPLAIPFHCLFNFDVLQDL